MGERQYLTLAEASARLSVHPNTLRNWGQAGTIRLVRLPGSRYRRVPVSEVERLLAAMAASDVAAPVVERPPAEPEEIAKGAALADLVKRELALAANDGTLEECMASLRHRKWSS